MLFAAITSYVDLFSDPLELVENLEPMAKLEKLDLKVYRAFQAPLDPLETRV